jgi:tetratricopeptide (TPR) repeat protein
LTVARLLRHAGKLDDALVTATRAREIDPRSPQAAELLGQTQLASGDSSGAVLSFTALVNMQPRYLQGHIQLARAEIAAGDRRSAAASLRQVLARAPANEEALSLLGALHIEQKAYGKALEVAEQAKTRLPVRALGHVLEGEVSLAHKQNKRAVAAFKRANELQPSGRLLVRVHQAESAELGRDAPVTSLMAWIERSPQDVLVRFYTADALVRLGRAQAAVPLYLEVLKHSPQDHRALNNLADALMRVRDPRALDYAQQAFNLRPGDPVPAATLGSVLLSRNKYFEAVQVLQKATQLDPKNAEIRYQFVLALAKAGDQSRARSELSALLTSGSVFPQIDEARTLAGQL